MFHAFGRLANLISAIKDLFYYFFGHPIFHLIIIYLPSHIHYLPLERIQEEEEAKIKQGSKAFKRGLKDHHLSYYIKLFLPSLM